MKKILLALLVATKAFAGGIIINPGSSGGSGGGVTTVGTFSASSQADGASISGVTITFGPADASNPGMVTTGADSWSGVKTFADAPVFSSTTASTALVVGAGKALASSSTTSTELAGLHGLTASRAIVTDGSGILTPATTTATEIGYVNGVTSAIQTQLGTKAPLASPTFTGVVTTANGSAASPSLVVGDNSGTGFYDGGTSVLNVATAGAVKYSWLANGDSEEYGTAGSNLTHTLYGSGTSGTFIGLDNSTGGLLYIKSSGSGEATTAQGIGTLYISGGTQAVKIRRDGRLMVGSGANTGRGGMIGIEAPADNTITGTTTANAATTITGSSTVFLYQVSVGDQIALSSAATTFAVVTAVASNTSLTVNAALGDGTSQSIIVRRNLISGYDINNSDALSFFARSNGQVGFYRHIATPGATPTANVNANAGASGTCSLTTSSDIAGKVTITPGGAGIAGGAQCAVTFASAYATAPLCQLTPADADAATADATLETYVTTSTTALTINVSNALTSGTAYVWNYSCYEPGI